MTVKPLTEHHLEYLSFKGGCTGSSESALVKMSHCWKSHVAAHFAKSITRHEDLRDREILILIAVLKHTAQQPSGTREFHC